MVNLQPDYPSATWVTGLRPIVIIYDIQRSPLRKILPDKNYSYSS